MARLNSVPLDQRADHPRLEEAAKLLLCYQHKATDFGKELEDASQKFRDAAEVTKKAEAARVKVCDCPVHVIVLDSYDEPAVESYSPEA
jgi:hypothetical protein